MAGSKASNTGTGAGTGAGATLPEYDYHEHIVDGVLPAREVHLFGGPSGAGKTTLLMKLMEDIAAGRPIFGHTSHPTPFVYISGDRSKADMARTMERLNIDRKSFPLFVPNITKTSTLQSTIDAALKRFPDARLVVVEGFATFVPGDDKALASYKNVGNWLRELQRYCELRNVTIWGVVHSAKAKKEDRYTSPRERILGSVSFGAYGNGIFYIEPEAADQTAQNPIRLLSILPRNGRDEFFKLDWRDGLLVPVAPKLKQTNWTIFRAWFDRLSIGEEFTIEAGRRATNLAESSFRFELKKVVDSGEATHYSGRPPGTYLKQKPGPGTRFENAQTGDAYVGASGALTN